MYLYFIIQKKNKHFKIGVTKNLKNRLLDLSEGWGLFDLDKSFYVEGPAEVIRSLECVIQYVFRNSNMNYTKNKPTGYTEFFKSSCFLNVDKTIRTLKFKPKKIDFKITTTDVREWVRFKAKFFAGGKNKKTTKGKSN